MAAMQLEMRNPKDLTPHPRNYRNHPDEQVRDIAASIAELGIYRPIVRDTQDRILAGHGVTLGAILRGMDEVPVFVFEGTEEQAIRLMVADNELSRGAVDDPIQLADLLQEIRDDGGTLEGTGWDGEAVDAAVEALAAEVASEEVDRPEVDFAEELMEAHNYVVLYFDNSVDWLQAETLLADLMPSVKSRNAQRGMPQQGIGRVVNGAKALDALRGAGQ